MSSLTDTSAPEPDDAATSPLAPPTAQSLPEVRLSPPDASCPCVGEGGWYMSVGETHGGSTVLVDRLALCDLYAQAVDAVATSAPAVDGLAAPRRAAIGTQLAARGCGFTRVNGSPTARLGNFEHTNGGAATLNFMFTRSERRRNFMAWLEAEWNGARWVLTRIHEDELFER